MSAVSKADCILWDGSKRADGYGRASIEGRRVYAHRVAYCEAKSIALDSIDGLVVRHRCDNPECVNPDHLETGTHHDNAMDTLKRGRTCIGEKHGMSKLSAEQVKAIKAAVFTARGDCVRLARQYGVSHATISFIRSGQRWGKATS